MADDPTPAPALGRLAQLQAMRAAYAADPTTWLPAWTWADLCLVLDALDAAVAERDHWRAVAAEWQEQASDNLELARRRSAARDALREEHRRD